MRFLFSLLFLLLSLSATAQTPTAPAVPSPARGVRAVWLCTYSGLDWPAGHYARTAAEALEQKAQLSRIFDGLQAAGINTVLFQTRIRATVAYPSHIEPWDGAFSGTPGVAPPYDVLRFAIDEAHRRGMELHAYLVTFPGNTLAEAKRLGRQSLPARMPQLCTRAGDKWQLDPGVPGTAEYLAELVREIVSRYDVDGIHLDYIRYPEPSIPFDDRRTYARYGHHRPKAEWRRENVNRTVQLISETVRAIRPWVKITCAPIGKYADLPTQSSKGWNARDAVSQDAQLWLRRGWMDGLFPMMYFDGQHFYPFAVNWQEHTYGRPVAPGLGAYQLAPEERNWSLLQIVRQLRFIHAEGFAGEAYFRSQFLLNNVKGLLDFVHDHYAQPQLPPAMTWLDSIAPAAPQWQCRRTDHALRFTWNAVADATPVHYNLYRLTPTGPVAVALRLSGTDFTYSPALPSLLDADYALTAMDAYGNESPLHFTHDTQSTPPRVVGYPSAFRPR